MPLTHDLKDMIDLPVEVLVQIFHRLDSPISLARCSLVNKSWHVASLDFRLWSEWCQCYWVPADPAIFTSPPSAHTVTTPLFRTERFHVGPVQPPPSLTQTWKDRDKDRFSKQPVSKDQARQVFAVWFQEFRGDYHALYYRLKGLSYRLLYWLRQNSTSTLASLLPGTLNWRKDIWEKLIEPFVVAKSPLLSTDGSQSSSTVQRQQQYDNLRAFALFYHFIDGQKPRMPHADAGLFGTYTCYTQFTSVFMLPSKYLRHERSKEFFDSTMIIFAVCPRTGYYLALVIHSRGNADLIGQVVHFNARTRRFLRFGLFLPWLEQYVGDMVGRQQYNLVGDERVLSIFKNHAPPYTSRALTRGILCEISTHCMLETTALELPWSYRVKFQRIGGGSDTPRVCQLVQRRWAIRYQSGLVEHVTGEGVIGHSPILSETSPLFTYCSVCASRPPTNDQSEDYPVEMEGEFEFVCGTVEAHDPRDNFMVRAAPFSFIIPERVDFVDCAAQP